MTLLLLKAPFVCNGCNKRSYASCRFVRHLYAARQAHIMYETTLVESREGIPLNKESFYQMDAVLAKAVHSGQSIYHAIHANALDTSQSSVYRYIHKGYCSFALIDLPRAVKSKPRLKHTEAYVSRAVRVGRSYQDFQDFIQLNPFLNVAEMDTVIGRPGGKVLMTFQFVNVAPHTPALRFGIFPPSGELPTGEPVRLPPLSFARTKIRHCNFTF